MRFIATKLKGAYIIEIDPIEDERGFFARTWCAMEFETFGLSSKLVQCNISYNAKRGTLRGMHYQVNPYEEIKIVRCTRGAIYDVIIDLRSNSATYKQWISVELTEANRKGLYIPAGFAHGFQTLQDNTEVFYQMSERYRAEYASGVRWNDPAFAIDWVYKDPIINERDNNFLLID